MPRWEPLHRDFAAALRILASFELSHAEALRLLRPVAARVGVPRPTYWRVRRFLIEERRRAERRKQAIEPVIRDLLAGLIPRS
jgi:hypothetical protein